MSAFNDNLSVTPDGPLDDRILDALVAGRVVGAEPALSGLVATLRTVADCPAPAPSAALAALFVGGLTPESNVVLRPGGRTRRRAALRPRSWGFPLQLSLTAFTAVTLVLAAAATDTLPDAAQNAVANVVEAVTPLTVPRPDQRGRGTPVPVVRTPNQPNVVGPSRAPGQLPASRDSTADSPSDAGDASPLPRNPVAGDGADDGKDRRSGSGHSKELSPADSGNDATPGDSRGTRSGDSSRKRVRGSGHIRSVNRSGAITSASPQASSGSDNRGKTHTSTGSAGQPEGSSG